MMKKILIVSDTHGDNANFSLVLKKVGKIDALIHCGDFEGTEYYYENVVDCPKLMVRGNNDFFTGLPTSDIITVNGLKILAVHGHRQHVYAGPDDALVLAKQNNADVVCYGHIHSPKMYYDEETKIWAVCPGSLCFPRQADRKYTYIILEVEEDGTPHFELNTL